MFTLNVLSPKNVILQLKIIHVVISGNIKEQKTYWVTIENFQSLDLIPKKLLLTWFHDGKLAIEFSK
jgi:hypothetical protein